MNTKRELARTIAATLLVATVAAGCATRNAPTVDPVAAPSTPASTTPDLPPSPTPEPEREPTEAEPPQEIAADTGQATAQQSPAPTQEATSAATAPPPDQPDDGLTELPSFTSRDAPGMAWTLTLHADAATGCMWIETDHEEHGRHVYATRFNQQYRGRFTTDPPQLVRIDHGEPVVVAAPGDTWEAAARIVEGQLDECHVGPENIIVLLY